MTEAPIVTPPEPHPVMVKTDGGEFRGFVTSWQQGLQVLVVWDEGADHYEQWLPVDRVRSATARDAPKPDLFEVKQRRSPSKSFPAKRESSCARCHLLIKVGDTARFAPGVGLVHHSHAAAPEVKPNLCRDCHLVKPCFC